MVDNYASDRSNYDSGFSHSALQKELVDRVQYEAQSVLARLRVSSVDDRFVAACKGTLESQLAEDIKTLKSLAAKADGYTVDHLESEADIEAKEDNVPPSEPKKSRREKLMYAPLVRVSLHLRRMSFG